MTATKSDGTDARSRDPRKRIEDAETAEATAETAQLEVSMMAAAIDRPAGRSSLRAELFSEAKVHWDAQHDRQIFCQHDADTVLLFRACCQHLGPHATQTGSFRGSPCYEKDRARMMWFDTSFLVSMRKSAWGTKSGREVVLAIWVRRSFFERCLGEAVCADTFGPSSSTSYAAPGTPTRSGRGGGPRWRRQRLGSWASSASEASVASPSRRSPEEGFGFGGENHPLTGGRRALDGSDDEVGLEDRKRAVTMDVTTGDDPGSAIGEVWLGGAVGGGGVEVEERARARSHSFTSSYHGRVPDVVRLHWEPERLPSGEKHRTRRVVQLGLKGGWLHELGSGDAVVKIERLDSLLAEQRAALNSSTPQLLRVPVVRPLDVGHLEDAQMAELHLVSERARPKLRILCLHGYLQNGQVFKQRTRQLAKKLRPTAELVFVDAPHLLRAEELPPPLPSLSSSPLEAAAMAASAAAAAAVAKVVTIGEGGAPGGGIGEGTGGGSPPPTPTLSEVEGEVEAAEAAAPSMEVVSKPDRSGARTWWRCDAEERAKAKAVKGMSGRCEWKGLEESLAFLRGVWDEQGPFDGLLGFSQGAAMASIFSHCAFGGVGGAGDNGDPGVFGTPLSPPPKFAVFISGCYQPHPTQVPSYPLGQEEAQKDLPSLHVWAVEDRFVPASQSQRLAGMYKRASVFMHRGSHCVPQTKDVVLNFVRFLEGFR